MVTIVGINITEVSASTQLVKTMSLVLNLKGSDGVVLKVQQVLMVQVQNH